MKPSAPGITAIQAEQVRNPRRSTWDVLLALEAAERIAAGEFEETVAMLPLRDERAEAVVAREIDAAPEKKVASGR